MIPKGMKINSIHTRMAMVQPIDSVVQTTMFADFTDNTSSDGSLIREQVKK